MEILQRIDGNIPKFVHTFLIEVRNKGSCEFEGEHCKHMSTITDKLKTKYKYDNVIQCDLYVMSECGAVYDYQESILKLG